MNPLTNILRISGKTKVAGLIGWPVAHSLSPLLHNYAAAQQGIDAVYVALPVRPSEVLSAVNGAKSLGFAGLNITTPHKEEVLKQGTFVFDEAASAVMATNALTFENDTAHAYNFDADGFSKLLPSLSLFPKQHATNVVIFGSGPAARAVAYACREACVVMVSRQETAAANGNTRTLDYQSEQLLIVIKEAHLIVNATPLGAGNYVRESPMPANAELSKDTLVMDLNYEPRETRMMSVAREQGCRTYNGLLHLCHQAALSFNAFFGGDISGNDLYDYLKECGHAT